MPTEPAESTASPPPDDSDSTPTIKVVTCKVVRKPVPPPTPTDPADFGESWPTDCPPVHLSTINFDNLRRVLTELDAITPGWITPDAIPPDPIPPDPITPSEAAEELDDREAEELAVIDAIEREADGQPGAKRSWAETDASVEADRRFDLDFLATASKIFSDHIRRPEGEESTGDEWKVKGVDTLPPGIKTDFLRFLRELAKTAGKLAAKYGEPNA